MVGSWGGWSATPPFKVGCCTEEETGEALERRWSRRQYEKTVDGAMVIIAPEQAPQVTQWEPSGHPRNLSAPHDILNWWFVHLDFSCCCIQDQLAVGLVSQGQGGAAMTRGAEERITE